MPDYHGWTHRPAADGGTDPIPGLAAGGSPAFAHLTTAPWGHEGDGSEKTLDWYGVYISDNGSAYFDYETEAAAGQFGDDRVWLRLLQGGVFTYTLGLGCSDLDPSQPEFYVQTRLQIAAGEDNAIPGSYGAGSRVQWREQLYIDEGGGDDVWLNQSWALPVKPGADASGPWRTGVVNLFYRPQPAGTQFWTARLWIVRHGDCEWAPDDFATTETTWP